MTAEGGSAGARRRSRLSGDTDGRAVPGWVAAVLISVLNVDGGSTSTWMRWLLIGLLVGSLLGLALAVRRLVISWRSDPVEGD